VTADRREELEPLQVILSQNRENLKRIKKERLLNNG